jgi:4'-phosphopantetheinyl transferase
VPQGQGHGDGHVWSVSRALPSLGCDQVHVWRLEVEEAARRRGLALTTLASDERARARAFSFAADRDRFVVARAALRSLLAAYLDLDPRRLRLGSGPLGKPILLEDGPIRFNVSHSDNLVLVAVAREREVGIDVERIRENTALEEIAIRNFSPAEVRALLSRPPEQRTSAFFSCWTRKEAYLKARGAGLHYPLDQFDVSLAPEPAALCEDRVAPGDAARWSLRDLAVAPGYAAALAVEGRGWRLGCWRRLPAVLGGAVLWGLVLAWAGVAASQSPAPAPAPYRLSEAPSIETGLPRLNLRSLGFGATLILKNFTQFQEVPSDKRHVRDEATLQVEWARALTSWASAKVVGEGRVDDDHFVDELTFQIPERSARRSYLYLKEAVLALQHRPVSLSLGKQIFAWGTADGWNPTDTLNPYDYMDPIDREKLAVYSAEAALTMGASSLTAVVIPFFTPSRTPLEKGRWVPPLPADFVGVVDNRELPETDISNVQYAVRLRTTIAGWDLTGTYYEGFDNTPVFRSTTTTLPSGDVVPLLTPVFTKIRAPGFAFSTTWQKFEFHGEAAVKLVERNGRDSRFQGIVGLNYTWADFDLRWLQQVNVIAEYANEEVISSDRSSSVLPLDPTFALPDRAFRHSPIARVLVKFSEETEAEVGGTANFAGPANYYLKVAVSQKVGEALWISAGLDFFAGPRDTFWGRWRDNDRFWIFLKYFF